MERRDHDPKSRESEAHGGGEDDEAQGHVAKKATDPLGEAGLSPEDIQAALRLSPGETFTETARRIYELGKTLLGAEAGYVALRTDGGTNNELLFLDPGELPCDVDPELPMPNRGLREEAYRSQSVVAENDYARSEHAHLMPEGHAPLHNVLFAPLLINGHPVGLIGLANKPGGFTDRDREIAGALAALASDALLAVQHQEQLLRSEARWRTLFDAMTDAVLVPRPRRCALRSPAPRPSWWWTTIGFCSRCPATSCDHWGTRYCTPPRAARRSAARARPAPPWISC